MRRALRVVPRRRFMGQDDDGSDGGTVIESQEDESGLSTGVDLGPLTSEPVESSIPSLPESELSSSLFTQPGQAAESPLAPIPIATPVGESAALSSAAQGGGLISTTPQGQTALEQTGLSFQSALSSAAPFGGSSAGPGISLNLPTSGAAASSSSLMTYLVIGTLILGAIYMFGGLSNED